MAEACRTQGQATGPPRAHASSPTRMLNRGRGQQSRLDQGTHRRHALPSLPSWIGIPGSFPNASSPHQTATSLNLNSVAVDTHGSKCNANLSLLSFWEPRVGPQFQGGDGRDFSLILFRFPRNAFVEVIVEPSTCSNAGHANLQIPPRYGQRAESRQHTAVNKAKPLGKEMQPVLRASKLGFPWKRPEGEGVAPLHMFPWSNL